MAKNKSIRSICIAVGSVCAVAACRDGSDTIIHRDAGHPWEPVPSSPDDGGLAEAGRGSAHRSNGPMTAATAWEGSGGNAGSDVGSDAEADAADAGEQEEYATDALMNAGCQTILPAMAVAANRQSPVTCERLTVIPLMDLDGDLFEVAAKTMWSVLTPGALMIHPVGSRTIDVAGTADLFDTPGFVEPIAAIEACVHNDCPQAADPPCLPTFCGTVAVSVVVNLEGEWCVTDGSGGPCETTQATQSGRDIAFGALGYAGTVMGATLALADDMATRRVLAMISPDRATLKGIAYDALSASVIGSWSAVRTGG